MMMTALAAFWLALAQDALPKIAELESVSGSVEIVNPKGASRKPAKFGTRLKNAEVRDEDRVKTGAGAQAVIVFPDASSFTLKEKSEIQVLQKDLPKATAEGRTIGRRLKLLFGDLVSEIAPNKDVATVFETAAGCAAVRGTRLRLTSGGASVVLEVTEGRVRYFHSEFAARFDVQSDQRLRFTQGSLIVEVEEDGGRPVDGRIGTSLVSLTRGDRFVIRGRKDDVNVEMDQGSLLVDGQEDADGFTAPTGEGTASEDGGFDPKAKTSAPLPEDGGGPQGRGTAAPDLPGFSEPIGPRRSFRAGSLMSHDRLHGVPLVDDLFWQLEAVNDGWTEPDPKPNIPPLPPPPNVPADPFPT